MGFVVGGKTPRRVLVRAVGPTLSNFGVANALATPALAVFSGQTPSGTTNTGWADHPELAAAALAVGAFPLTPGSRDAARLLTLSPGSYTLQISGGAGEVLTEIYFVE
jgi:hypothetical protein